VPKWGFGRVDELVLEGPGAGRQVKGALDVLRKLTIPRARERSAAANTIRKPMLYPLSYEGLPVHLPSVRVVSGRWAWVGYLAPTACAASVPRAVWPASAHRLNTRHRLYGW